MNVLVDSRTGTLGTHADWVARFGRIWEGGRERLDDFMTLFGEHVKLSAPGLRTTEGHEACRAAFAKTFEVMPDLTARVDRWASAQDVLFIEMTFAATIGGRRIEWSGVDRFLFRDGAACERHAYFNPMKVRRAFLSGPRGWRQLLRRYRSGL